MKIEHSKYQLVPETTIGSLADASPREGALLRLTWPDGKSGYADCFPWPELGDLEIDGQLHKLAEGHITPLMEQSFWLARRDAEWRADKINPYKKFPKVKNNYLIADLTKVTEDEISRAKANGFTTFKIKVGKDPEEEAKWVDRFIKIHQSMVRLDFNCKSNFPKFERFVSILNTSTKARVEYAEDPFIWKPELWKEASRLLPLAADAVLKDIDFKQYQDEKPPFQFLIVKPARQDMTELLSFADKHAMKFVITNSLDHSVGEAHAALVAAELKKKYPNRLLECGCFPSRIYRPNDFSMAIVKKGPFFEDVRGSISGIGFDEYFGLVKWKTLSMK